MIADNRDVAGVFEKRHTEVLRAIRNLGCSEDFRRRNFASFKIKHLTGESSSRVEMTRDGFSRLVMSFTRDKAALRIERYIEAFNRMEEAIRANAIVAPIHPKALPVLLTSPVEVDLWLAAETPDALDLQRP